MQPAIKQTFLAAAISATLAVVQPTIKQTVAINPVAATLTVKAPTMRVTVAVSPTALDLTPVAPFFIQTFRASPVAGTLTPVAPSFVQAVAMSPILMAITVVAPSTAAAFVVPFSILPTMQTIQSHLMSGGAFVSVELGQPSAVAPGQRITAAIWIERIQVGNVFLGVVDKIYEVNIRLYRDMLAEPQEQGELDLALTVQDIGSDLLGDFDLGATVRNIDAGGIYGTPMSARWGYTSVANVMFRSVDITVPIIVNDAIALTASVDI